MVPADFTARLTDALGHGRYLLAGKIRCWTWRKERNTACPDKRETRAEWTYVVGSCRLHRPIDWRTGTRPISFGWKDSLLNLKEGAQHCLSWQTGNASWMDIRGWFLPTSPADWLTHWDTAEIFWLERFAAEPDGRSATLLVLTNGKRELNGHTWLVPADFTARLTDALGHGRNLLAGEIRCWTCWGSATLLVLTNGKRELNGHTWLVPADFTAWLTDALGHGRDLLAGKIRCWTWWKERNTACPDKRETRAEWTYVVGSCRLHRPIVWRTGKLPRSFSWKDSLLNLLGERNTACPDKRETRAEWTYMVGVLPTSPPDWLTHWDTAEIFWLERFAAEPAGKSATLLVLTNGKRELNGHTWLVPADFTARLSDALGNCRDLLAGKIRCWTCWESATLLVLTNGKRELNGHTWLVPADFTAWLTDALGHGRDLLAGKIRCWTWWKERNTACPDKRETRAEWTYVVGSCRLHRPIVWRTGKLPRSFSWKDSLLNLLGERNTACPEKRETRAEWTYMVGSCRLHRLTDWRTGTRPKSFGWKDSLLNLKEGAQHCLSWQTGNASWMDIRGWFLPTSPPDWLTHWDTAEIF